MKTIFVTDSQMTISEDAHIVDLGNIETATIEILPNIEAKYTILSHSWKSHRHIKISENSVFTGKWVLIENADVTVISEVVGDNVEAFLDILAIAKTNANISVEGVARVAKPYKKINTRVDQINILIGEKSIVRGVPKLEIATNDIEGGHSCKIHRLHGDALFYLESHGIETENAESLLLQSEIITHLETLPEDLKEEKIQYITQKLLEKF